MPEVASKRPVKNWLIGVGYGLLYLVALAAGTVSGWVGESEVLSEITIQTLKNETQEEVFKREELTLLLLGLDEQRIPGGRVARDEDGNPVPGRADSILVVRLDFDDNEISAISIPRDTLASPPGYRTNKINSFMAVRGGGKELMEEAVADVTGLVVDRTVVLNYDAFREVVDQLGGIQIDVPKRMRYHDRRGDLHIDLQPGVQVLDGEQAMGFVRYRSDGDDFLRQDRQKQFLLALKEKVKQDPKMVNRIADLAIDISGGEFSAKEIAALARFSNEVDPGQIQMGMIPVVEARNYNLQVDTGRLEETLRELKFLEPSQLSLNNR